MAEIELCPTAYRLKRGHRIRVQITAGAFPRWDRNPAAGVRLLHHDPAGPSAVKLPILERP
ncbi:CocE/NonD family hydrolase C-terminal non-catalytic domain-containing protein [Nonomuraea sp. 10N515B]|uniref:CocE/NonD family hydrolase C-terminal non-catalytic domain-containing protein n=1 Tax=Nonomuraea sp. 10N515B TaxID=3457422 RepID=UPI003FCEE139